MAKFNVVYETYELGCRKYIFLSVLDIHYEGDNIQFLVFYENEFQLIDAKSCMLDLSE